MQETDETPYPLNTLFTSPSLSLYTRAMAAASPSVLFHLTTTAIFSPQTPCHLLRKPAVQVAARTAVRAYKVQIEHGGETRVVEVEEDETILARALEEGLEVPHDCKLGVCMTCPARLVAGEVDQSEGMLSDDVVGRGYALLCASYPRSDCTIRTIPEEELLALQLATAND